MSTLMQGHLLGTTSIRLNHEDLFLIGSVALANEMYEDALIWLHYSEEKLNPGLVSFGGGGSVHVMCCNFYDVFNFHLFQSLFVLSIPLKHKSLIKNIKMLAQNITH